MQKAVNITNHSDDLYTCIYFWPTWWLSCMSCLKFLVRFAILACYVLVELSDEWSLVYLKSWLLRSLFVTVLKSFDGTHGGMLVKLSLEKIWKKICIMIEHYSGLHQSWHICAKYHSWRLPVASHQLWYLVGSIYDIAPIPVRQMSYFTGLTERFWKLSMENLWDLERSMLHIHKMMVT